MKPVCILTDGMAQFLDLEFSGQELVQLMPMQVDIAGANGAGDEELRPNLLPHARSGAVAPGLRAPSVEDFARVYLNLALTHDEIVVVASCGGLTESYHNAAAAAEQTRGRCRVEVIDTGTVGVGQGILVAAAAVQSASGMDGGRLKKYLLGVSEKVYSVFCLKNMAYLVRLGLISTSQAYIGEMLGVQQLFYLNAGTLIPVQKVRNSRHLVESMLEFVAEFNDPQRVALQQAATGYQQEARTIRERLLQEYPEVGINELALTLPLAALFGPESLGLFLWEVVI
ncbi:MAG TPA: DegV family protein [Anaerolineales bacterium]|nr:DegV family protein [Anaerolineales bacterium]